MNKDKIMQRAQHDLAQGQSGAAPKDLTPQGRQIYETEVAKIRQQQGQKG